MMNTTFRLDKRGNEFVLIIEKNRVEIVLYKGDLIFIKNILDSNSDLTKGAVK